MKNFNEIYKQYFSIIVNFINLKINNFSVSEELTNDVFLKFYNSMHKYNENRAKLSTYIHYIAKNIVIDYYRKKELETVSIENFNTDNNENYLNPVSQYRSDDNINIDIANKKLNKGLSNMNDDQFEIFNLYYFSGASINDISMLLNMNINTIKGHMKKARNIIMKSFKLSIA